MTRIARSAQTLVRQVSQKFPDVEVQQDDLDGLGVYRTLVFSGEEAVNWLSRGDLALLLDQRISDASVRDEDGAFVVTFVADPRADYANPPFSLQAVVAVSDAAEVTDADGGGPAGEILESLDAGRISPDEVVDSAREIRQNELQAQTLADLRKTYPEYAGRKKRELISGVLADEF